MSDEEKKKEQMDLHEEIHAGKELKKISGEELHEINKNRQQRLDKIEEVKEIYDNAQNMMKELTQGSITLSAVPEEDKKTHEFEKQKRLADLESLKENIVTTSELLDEIKEGTNLAHVSSNIKDEYEKGKQERIDLLFKADKQLINFGNLLDELKDDTSKLQPISASDTEQRNKQKELQKEEFKKATEHLNSFGTILSEISQGKSQLQKIDDKELEEYQQDKQKRLSEISQLKSKIELATSLIGDMTKELKLDPLDQDQLKDELLSKFQIASNYLKKIESEKTAKLEEVTGLRKELDQMGELFAEIKTASLQPVSEDIKKEISKDKLERQKDVEEIKQKLLAKFDVTASLMAEIQEAPALKEIPMEEFQEIQAQKFKRRNEMDHLKTHMAVAEELLQAVEKGIELTKINKHEKLKRKEEQEKRIDELGALKGKLDVVEELMSKIVGEGIALSKIDEQELAKHTRIKEERMEEINSLKKKIERGTFAQGRLISISFEKTGETLHFFQPYFFYKLFHKLHSNTYF